MISWCLDQNASNTNVFFCFFYKENNVFVVVCMSDIYLCVVMHSRHENNPDSINKKTGRLFYYSPDQLSIFDLYFPLLIRKLSARKEKKTLNAQLCISQRLAGSKKPNISTSC